MTHIIGKHPAPKRGVTFADVQRGQSLEQPPGSGLRYTLPLAGNASDAVSWTTGATSTFDADAPVVLLRTEPVDPAPDPGVTTYGELRPGEYFVFPDTPTIIRERVAIETTHRQPKATGCQIVGSHHAAAADSVCHWAADELVRRVTASVVVHKEPGTCWMRGVGEPVVLALDDYCNGGPALLLRGTGRSCLVLRPEDAPAAAGEISGVRPRRARPSLLQSSRGVPWVCLWRVALLRAIQDTWANYDAARAGEGGGS